MLSLDHPGRGRRVGILDLDAIEKATRPIRTLGGWTAGTITFVPAVAPRPKFGKVGRKSRPATRSIAPKSCYGRSAVNISSLANGALGEHRRAIPPLAQRGRVGRAEGRQQDLTRGKYPRDLSPALFRDGYAQLLLRHRGCSRALWLPGIGGPSREPVGCDDAGTCARRQPLERALSDLPQIPAPGRGVSATSQPVREVGSSIPTVQLLFQTHARGDEILPWQNDRNNREPTCGNEPREIGNRSWRTLVLFPF